MRFAEHYRLCTLKHTKAIGLLFAIIELYYHSIITPYQTKDKHKLYVVCTFRSPLLSPWRTAAAPSFVPNPSDGLFDMVVNLRRI